MLSQNRVQSRARNMKVALALRHCKPDCDGSLSFAKKMGVYICWSVDLLACLLTYIFTGLITYLLRGTESFLKS
jgi:hypothetical protein